MDTVRSRRMTRAGLLVVALLSSAPAQCDDWIVHVSDRSFDETVQQLQWAFGGYGLTTVTAIDYREILRQIKVDTGRAVVFEVMRREWLKTLLTEDPALGCIMPIRIYVFENADAMTLVSYQKAGAQLQVHSKESVRDFGRQLDQKLDALVALATKRHSSNR
jgi:uncharacterized protein (DUF302 family)